MLTEGKYKYAFKVQLKEDLGWLSLNADEETSDKLKAYLRDKKIYFEPSSNYDLIHFEIQVKDENQKQEIKDFLNSLKENLVENLTEAKEYTLEELDFLLTGLIIDMLYALAQQDGKKVTRNDIREVVDQSFNLTGIKNEINDFYKQLNFDLEEGLTKKDVEEMSELEVGDKVVVDQDMKDVLDKSNEMIQEYGLKESLNVIGDLKDYTPWGDAVSFYNDLVEQGKIEELKRTLELLYPDGITLNQLNDLLSFEQDFIKSMLDLDDTTEETTNDFEINDEIVDDDVEVEEKEKVETSEDDDNIEDIESVLDTTNDEDTKEVDLKIDAKKYLNDSTGYGDELPDDDESFLD